MAERLFLFVIFLFLCWNLSKAGEEEGDHSQIEIQSPHTNLISTPYPLRKWSSLTRRSEGEKGLKIHPKLRHYLHNKRDWNGNKAREKRWKQVSNGIESNESNPHSTSDSHEDGRHGIHVASWRWDEIGIYFTFTTFIIVAGLAKVAFHHAHAISSRIPESCLLILLGTAVGGILYAAGVGICEGIRGATRIPGCSPPENNGEDYFAFPTFTPKLFFLILLPPIILESSYSLYDRAFADNLGTVVFYAVIGTVFNTFVIGLSLVGLVGLGWIGSVQVPTESTTAWWSGSSYTLTTSDCLVFSSLISAVDPVAVLAIFQEVGVNKDLYFLVFGESLLNDAVTVVLYSTMVAFATMDHISGEHIALGLASFFTVSFGGLAIGIICGLLTALITRTTSEVRVVEPLAVLGMAYFSYLSAELFHFSGIISCIGCGLVQSHYAFSNVSHKSFTTVKYFIKMLSSTSDAIIFLFLGMVLVNDIHEWHTGFALSSLFLCLVVRFIGVFLLTAIANRFRLKPINLQEQFIMAYGGLRGAVSFSLVEMLEPSDVRPRQMFVTTTLAVILFTVFVQGGTIKLFVRLLNIEKNSKSIKHLTDEINETMIDHITAGIEEICGKRGNNYFREVIDYVDDRYLRKIFTRRSETNSLTRLFEKLALTEHYANMYAATGHTGITPIPSSVSMEAAEGTAVLKDGEKLPLLSPLPVPPRRDSLNVTAAGKFPLVRQSSAPPYVDRVRTDLDNETPTSLSEFPDVELRTRNQKGKKSRPNSVETGSINSNSLDPEVTAHAFRKALRSSSISNYKRLYQKHNRNLIGDDENPELEMVLRRRLSSAPHTPGRFAQAVSIIMNSPLSSPGTNESRRNSEILLSPTQSGSFEGVLPLAVGIRPEMLKKVAARRFSETKTPTMTSPPPAVNEHGERQSKTRSRPDSRPTFPTLGIIAEGDNETRDRSMVQIHDLEEEDEVFTRDVSKNTKETGV